MTLSEKIAAVEALGFTERQARFLALVMQNGGVCVPRQYATFAGTAYGQRVNRFFDRLVRRRYAVPCACVHNRAHVFHVLHRALYAAIADPHSRFRRPVPASRVVERLMRLDAVLPLADVDWLTSDAQKQTHLTALCAGESAHRLPTPSDRWPWGLDGDGRTLFVFLANPEDGSDALRGFLRRHLELWRAVPSWTLRLVFPRRLADVREAYQALVEEELECPLDPHTAETLRTSFEQLKVRCSRIHSPVEMDLHVERVLRLPRLVRLYSRWLLEGDAVLTDATSRVLAEGLAAGRARIESLVLTQDYRHLAPLVAGRLVRAEGVEEGAHIGATDPGQPQPPSPLVRTDPRQTRPVRGLPGVRRLEPPFDERLARRRSIAEGRRCVPPGAPAGVSGGAGDGA